MDLAAAALSLALVGPLGAATVVSAPPVAAPVTRSIGAAPAAAAAAPPAPSAPVERATTGRSSPAAAPSAGGSVGEAKGARWAPPVAPLRVVRGFDAPLQNWLPGHRGVDLAAPPGTPVRAPADGRVAFAGTVAGKPVVSIDHPDPRGDGTLRTTYEPVTASVTRGTTVRRGDVVGVVGPAGASHCVGACLHWGARRGRSYVDPLALLGGPIRLLPPRGP